jgi:hypothetical protein
LDFRQVGSRQQRSTILAWPCKSILVAQNLSVASKNLQWPLGGKTESRSHLGMLKVNNLSHSYLNVMKLENYGPQDNVQIITIWESSLKTRLNT